MRKMKWNGFCHYKNRFFIGYWILNRGWISILAPFLFGCTQPWALRRLTVLNYCCQVKFDLQLEPLLANAFHLFYLLFYFSKPRTWDP